MGFKWKLTQLFTKSPKSKTLGSARWPRRSPSPRVCGLSRLWSGKAAQTTAGPPFCCGCGSLSSVAPRGRRGSPGALTTRAARGPHGAHRPSSGGSSPQVVQGRVPRATLAKPHLGEGHLDRGSSLLEFRSHCFLSEGLCPSVGSALCPAGVGTGQHFGLLPLPSAPSPATPPPYLLPLPEAQGFRP